MTHTCLRGSHYYQRSRPTTVSTQFGKTQTWSIQSFSGDLSTRPGGSIRRSLLRWRRDIRRGIFVSVRSSRDQDYMLDTFMLVLEIIVLIGVVVLAVAVIDEWWSGQPQSCDALHRTGDHHRSNPHKWPLGAGGTRYRVLAARSVAGPC